MTDTLTDQNIDQQDATAEQDPQGPTVEERIRYLEDAFAEHLCDALRGVLSDAVLREQVKDLRRKVDELANQPQPAAFGELVTAGSDNTHVRVQTTKNTKGYGFETVVAVDGPDSTIVSAKVRELLLTTNGIARDECDRLEALDQAPTAREGEVGNAPRGDSDGIL